MSWNRISPSGLRSALLVLILTAVGWLSRLIVQFEHDLRDRFIPLNLDLSIGVIGELDCQIAAPARIDESILHRKAGPRPTALVANRASDIVVHVKALDSWGQYEAVWRDNHVLIDANVIGRRC